MPQIDPHQLAETIAGMLRSEGMHRDNSSIASALDKINERLDLLEASVASAQVEAAEPAPLHPSQAKFAIAEAIADGIFDRAGKEKACTFEPNGKPCDHCSMCSSRGF